MPSSSTRWWSPRYGERVSEPACWQQQLVRPGPLAANGCTSTSRITSAASTSTPADSERPLPGSSSSSSLPGPRTRRSVGRHQHQTSARSRTRPPRETGFRQSTAAAASWASVLQTTRERLSAQPPELLLEVVEELTTKQVSIHIHNHGGPAVRLRLRPFSPVKAGSSKRPSLRRAASQRPSSTSAGRTSCAATRPSDGPESRLFPLSVGNQDPLRDKIRPPVPSASVAGFAQDANLLV
jgi:hypothetical protein